MAPRSKKKVEQQKISSTLEEDAYNKMVSEWIDAYTATEEDICRYVLPHEEEELCRRVPCRVKMGRFNLVYDYAKKFGARLNNKPLHSKLKLLAKAVNRYKEDVYSDVEIAEQREKEWPDRKKCMLLQLDYWKYQREKAEQLEKANNSVSVVSDNNDLIASSQSLEIVPQLSEIDQQEEQHGPVTAEDNNDLIASPQSLEIVPQLSEINHQEEQNDPVTAEDNEKFPEIQRFYRDINTESISLNTQSMDMYSLNQESEEVLLNTEEFNLSIPITSTQELQK